MLGFGFRFVELDKVLLWLHYWYYILVINCVCGVDCASFALTFVFAVLVVYCFDDVGLTCVLF